MSMNEFVLFLNCVCIGFFTSLVLGLSLIVKKALKNNTFVTFAIDFAIFLLGAMFVMGVCFKHYNGIFAFFEIFGFSLGVISTKKSCENLFAKIFDMVYNTFTKIWLCMKSKRFFKRILR